MQKIVDRHIIIFCLEESDPPDLTVECPFCGSICEISFEEPLIPGRLNIWRTFVDFSGCDHLKGCDGKIKGIFFHPS